MDCKFEFMEVFLLYMEECVLSCIIPLYNGKNYIESCVNEILKIKHKKEIIIVNDGSTDDSFCFCESVYSNNKSVKLLSQKNGGIASARNFGLAESIGQYVIFIDQDDKVVSSTIDKAIDMMNSTDCDAYFWSTAYHDEIRGNKACDEVLKDIEIEGSDLDEIYIKFLMHKPNKYISYMGHVWAGIYKKQLIKANQIRFYKFVDYEDDYNFILNYLNISNKIGFISNVGYLWRVNYESYSRSYRYIDDFIEKSKLLYKDIQAKKRYQNFTQKQQCEVEHYWRQYIILGAIRNCTNQGKINLKALKDINGCLKMPLYKDAFKYKCLMIDKRERLLYYLIRFHLVGLAIFFVCLHFKIKR